MQLRNGKCYISEIEAWWNGPENQTERRKSDVQCVMEAVKAGIISKGAFRVLMDVSYRRHLYMAKIEAVKTNFFKKMAEICDDTDDEDDDEDDEEDDTDAFECPNCCCVLKGDAANDERVWIATKCDCGTDDENCANCGYDVCMECEDECQEREEEDGNARD